jgi:hypothetical protein
MTTLHPLCRPDREAGLDGRPSSDAAYLYDLALLWAFRHIKPPEESRQA